MANMRNQKNPRQTHIATALTPTHIMPRQAKCKNKNGIQRSQFISYRSSSLKSGLTSASTQQITLSFKRVRKPCDDTRSLESEDKPIRLLLSLTDSDRVNCDPYCGSIDIRSLIAYPTPFADWSLKAHSSSKTPVWFSELLLDD